MEKSIKVFYDTNITWAGKYWKFAPLWIIWGGSGAPTKRAYIIIPKRAMIMISNYYVSTAIIGCIKNLSISHLFMRLINKCDIEFFYFIA